MMVSVKIYYNPRCITCRRSIDRLKISKVDFELHDFFKENLSKKEIKSRLKMAGLSARDLLRKKDKMYKELKSEQKNYTEDELVVLMAKRPALILRPIIVRGNKAVIANKPEIAETFCKRGLK
ncbi:MAG: arsenate reductase family protein [Nitrososphaerales archaeon]